MRSVRVQRRKRPGLLAGLALAGLLALTGGCGPRPADEPRIQRGTALPPPGVTVAPAR